MAWRRVAVIETGHDVGALCPFESMVRVSYDGIIGDAPGEALPLERLFEVSDILRRHAYFTMVERKMDTHNTGAIWNRNKGNSTRALPSELSRVNLNAAGIDVGASSHFRGGVGGAQ